MFDKLIGNDRIKTILRRMLVSGRLPHSLLFAGAEGIGKRQFALETAKAFVCQNPVNYEACDACPACRRAGRFVFPKSDDRDAHQEVVFSEHPDVGMVVPYGKNILVDAVRDLEKEANFRPYEAKARFLIIDDAEKLNTARDNAANALLKTLEEPPPSSYIFLVTSRPDALLSTILSRCQTLRFAPVPPQEIEELLLKTEKFSPIDAELLAKISGGSIGRALSMNLPVWREGREKMLNVLESLLVRKDRLTLLKTAEEMNDAKNKDNYDSLLAAFETLIHDLWLLRLGREEIVNADIKNHLQRFAGSADPQRLAAWLREIETLRENFNVNLNRKIATDALFMQMAG